MPPRIKRKTGKKIDARLYQAKPGLSTIVTSKPGLQRWLRGVVEGAPPHVWLLSGPLGAGKTTLVQVLGRILKVRGDVTSPTFSLQKIHPLHGQPWKRLVHLDAYRLRSEQEIAALELPEYLADPASLVVVEWPERLPDVVWGRHLQISIAPGTSPATRKITLRRA